MLRRGALCLVMAGCTLRGSGVNATEVRPTPAFDAVSNTTSLLVFVRDGAEPSVLVNCDDNLVEWILTEVSGDELTVRIDGPRNLKPRTDCFVKVVAPALRALHASGSGSIQAGDAWPQLSEVGVSGSGNVDVSGVDVDDLSASLSGSGTLSLQGQAQSVNVDISGSGTIDGRRLSTAQATIQHSSSGMVTLTVTNAADVDLSGSGDVVIYGGASVDAQTSGSGQVIER